MNKPARIPIIYIEWVDAYSNSEWFDKQQLEDWISKSDGMYCADVGFLIHETKRMLVFAQRRTGGEEEKDWGGVHKIPKTWVRNRRVLGYVNRDGKFRPHG